MTFLLLIVIYFAFISLGLPDSLLGSAWPNMYQELGVSIASAGIISMVIGACTVISSFLSEKVIKRFGTSHVTLVSVLLTALALLGFSYSHNFTYLLFLAIPLGLGAGSIDAALNNYVALHFKAKHMNWLHCFWGVGATAGPILMSFFLGQAGGWSKGYRLIALIQLLLFVIILISLPIWKKVSLDSEVHEEKPELTSNAKNVLQIRGAKPTLLILFFYCSAEMITGLWGSSYLVTYKGISVEIAAGAISLYYAGITIGRMLSGFLSMKFDNKTLVRLGSCISILGIVILLLIPSNIICILSLLLIGLGFAPIYPATIHETPRRFGSGLSQKIIGYQMGCAYVGITFMPMILGQISVFTGFGIFPIALLVTVSLMILMSELSIKGTS